MVLGAQSTTGGNPAIASASPASDSPKWECRKKKHTQPNPHAHPDAIGYTFARDANFIVGDAVCHANRESDAIAFAASFSDSVTNAFSLAHSIAYGVIYPDRDVSAIRDAIAYSNCLSNSH